MSNVTISESIKYIGADDTTLDLFESQYIIPNGISYNSYVILDEKVAVMDTIDARKSEEWFNNLSNVLAGRNVDYIVISHLEPDHAANIKALSDKYPDAKLVLSAKAKAMLPQFFAMDNLDDAMVLQPGQEAPDNNRIYLNTACQHIAGHFLLILVQGHIGKNMNRYGKLG